MVYLLDANVFIQAKNLHYGFDFCPAFWDWLEKQNAAGKVFSIEKVEDELIAGNDDLATWAKAQGTAFFLRPDTAVLPFFGQVSAWVKAQQYDPAAIYTFEQVADYYLIAQALAQNAMVVTHEVPANTRKKIKIPNVCIGLNVKHMTPFEMLRREGAKFVLGRNS